MKCTDQDYMLFALEQAQMAAEHGDVPVGAVIVRDGKIIAAAHNRREQTGDATAHAEILAIQEACHVLQSWRLIGCTMYVTLEPCPMCAGACVNARLDRVVYGARDAKTGALGSLIQMFALDLNHTPRITTGILEEQSIALLQDFFERKRQRTNAMDK